MTQRPSGPPAPRKKRPRAPKPDAAAVEETAPAPKPRARKAPARRIRSGPPTPVGSRRPPLPRGMRTGLIAAGSCLAILLVVMAGFVLMPGPGDGKHVEVEWTAETTSFQAASRLSDAGLVRAPWLFGMYAALSGGTSQVSEGVHLLSDDMSPRTLLRRLRRLPGGATVRVAIPEGLNKFEIARRMHDAGVCSSRALLAASVDRSLLTELRLAAPDAEGYLFPATYELQRNADPREIVRRMVIESDRRYARLFDQFAPGLADLKSSLGMGRHEAIILASIVEKEAAVDEERPLIASVFLNRLRDANQKVDRRKLQSDPTARYGCLLYKLPSCESPDGKVTPAMIHDPANPYSTYAHPGITPGPIANPGEKSLQAVLSPAQTRYQFFVSRGNGRHTFSESFEEHRDAIRGGRK